MYCYGTFILKRLK